jgi:hypothetical protein
MLPHFRNITSANAIWEPVYANLFEIAITLPPIITTNSTENTRLLLENATNIKLDVTKNIEEQRQQFKYSSRTYATTPSETLNTFDIKFNINQNEQKAVESWVLLKRWYDLAWNSQTGELHYKSDMIGQITAHIHDRTGEVIRRVDFVNCQIKGIDGWELTFDNYNGIQSANASFLADYWIDTYFDVADNNQ